MTHSDEMIGQKVGDYRLLERIGGGGMSEGVYHARHEKLDNDVAIKVMDIGASLTDDRRQRILSEPRRTARLNHPNIVKVYNVIDDGPRLYMVLEFAPAGDLLKRLEQHRRRVLSGRSTDSGAFIATPLPSDFVASVIQQVANALDYAHNQGLIHRDIKPSNILLTDGDHVLVTDFGIAKAMQATELSVTREGVGIGTPPYMSPEQIRGEDLTPASDEYSLAIVAYQMLTGIPPFQGDSSLVVAHKHLNEAPPAPRSINPDLSRQTEAVLLKALSKPPKERYGRVGTFASQLSRTLVESSKELKLPTLSLWKRVEQTSGWGTFLRISRMVSTLFLGLFVTLLRSAAYILIGLVLFLAVVLFGGSYLASRFLETSIAEHNWGFSSMAADGVTAYPVNDIQSNLTRAIRQYLPGTVDNVALQFITPDSVQLTGQVSGYFVQLRGSITAIEGAPVVKVQEFNGRDPWVLGGLLAGGINRGFIAALNKSGHRITAIELSEAAITLTVEGPATQITFQGSDTIGDYLVSEDFSDLDSGWPRAETFSAAEVGYDNGLYRMEVHLPYLSVFQDIEVAWSAYDIAVDARLESGPQNAAYGLALLETDKANYISVLVTGDGFVLAEAVIDGERRSLPGWDGWHPLANTEGRTSYDHIVVGVHPPDLTVQVNGEEIGRGSLPPELRSGRVGLLVQTASQGEAVVAFDNLIAQAP